jgi:hypothetical protein
MIVADAWLILPGSGAGAWTPVVSVTISIARRAVAVIDVPAVVNTDARTSIVMTVVGVSIVRVSPVRRVINVQVMVRPADIEGGRYAPEVAGSEAVASWIRVVIHRIRVGIVVIHPARLIHNDFLGFVIRNVDNLLIDRCDFNRTLAIGDGLVVI